MYVCLSDQTLFDIALERYCDVSLAGWIASDNGLPVDFIARGGEILNLDYVMGGDEVRAARLQFEVLTHRVSTGQLPDYVPNPIPDLWVVGESVMGSSTLVGDDMISVGGSLE